MSWIGGYKAKPTEADIREAKRKKLEADRLKRAQERSNRQQKLLELQQAQQKSDEAIQDLLNIDPNLLDGDDVSVTESEADNLLADEVSLNQPPPEEAGTMTDFDRENGVDAEKALDKLGGIKVPFDQSDIEYWFCELEGQLETIGVKSQWVKRIALQQFLPVEVRAEVKSLMKIQKSAAGDDIYKRIKTELIDLFGQKPEDAYIRAKNRVMTGKPSQLGKAIIEDLCDKDKKLDGCCCSKITWGMIRDQLPVVVRNHVAELKFNKDTYKDVLATADKVFDSNQAPEPVPQRTVAAVAVQSSPQSSTQTSEVAAVQKPKKNKNQKGQNQNKNQEQSQSEKPKNKSGVNDENLCRMHAKWKGEANFCSAPWKCKMKNIWKAPQ